MRKSRIAASVLALTLAATTMLSGCKPGETSGDSGSGSSSNNSGASGSDSGSSGAASGLTYADGTVLRMACGYNSVKTGIAFDAETAGSGITLANGKTYHTGDLKPTWETLQERLKITFEDHYQGSKSASDEWDFWKAQLDKIDMVAGSAKALNEYANTNKGSLVNIADYLDQMPNFKAYLEANPIVRLSITGSTSGDNAGAIYFSPYFDGVNDIERMPLMRTDWVEKLLNYTGEGEDKFTAESTGQTATPAYQPYMPTEGKVEVDIVTVDADGKANGTGKLTKDYDAYGNIVDEMNKKGSMSGVEAVNMLREYIDKTYNGYYKPENRADLFIGQDAAWDADELVALLRCVVANNDTFTNGGVIDIMQDKKDADGNVMKDENGKPIKEKVGEIPVKVQGLFSREDENNQRRVDMFRFAATLFGVRGLESRMDYLYVGTDGDLHDARQEAATYEAMARMNDMMKEGLISDDFKSGAPMHTDMYLENDMGLMHYDYNQTQTVYNKTKLDNAAGEKYMAVMVPVARWNDGTEKYMRFTESWRSVKTDAWALSAKGIGNDTDKLNAALKLIDYAYSPEGQILMSYGPDEFIKQDASGNFVTFDFNGEQWPEIADATYQELWDKANGNYTNYARNYLGSTLSFVKSQSFEFECTHEVGKEGAGHISTAIGLGVIQHPELALASNSWYTSVPTVLPFTGPETAMKDSYSELADKGNFNSSKGGKNMFVDMICKGVSGVNADYSATFTDAASVADTVANTWSGKQYLQLCNDAWHRLVDFYNTLNA